MRVVIRTYKSGQIEWWVLSNDGLPMGAGTAKTRRQAFVRGRHHADQYATEVREGFANAIRGVDSSHD